MNLLSQGEKERIANERKKRSNPYIDEKYYEGGYASSRMITGPWSKALLSMCARDGNKKAQNELAQILEAESILWPERNRRILAVSTRT